VSDWLDDGVTGYLCKPKSAEEIASYAIRILNDRELMNTMGRAGQESIKNKFLPEIHLRKLEQVYASCV
ncbi:MAG: glycosyltransferase, partial [Opitutae bacterium]|nr:glycosyltransferase [Opitutae bacterium]